VDKIMAAKKNTTNSSNTIKKAREFIENNKLDFAINILKEGQANFPNDLSFINLLAEISLRNKNLQEGINLLKKSIKINQKQPVVMFDLGIALSINNQLDEAIIFFHKSTELDPKNLKYLIRKALTLKTLGRLNDSLDCYQKIIELNPNIIEAYINQAEVLDSIGKKADSLLIYEKAVEIEPENPTLYILYGNLLDKLGQSDEAMNAYKKSIEIKPDNSGALNNLGYLLIRLRRFDEGIFYLKKSIQITPNFEVYKNIGIAYCSIDNNLESIIYFDKSIKIKSDDPQLHVLKAIALQSIGKIDQAILSYSQALESDKDYKYVLGWRLYAKKMICDWSNFIDDLNLLELKIKENKKVAVPLAIVSLFEDPVMQKIGSEIHVNDLYPFNNSLGPIKKSPKNKKIKIGYFSGDFREHPVGYLVTEIFENHDKSKFELFAFSTSKKIESRTRSRIEKSFDEFIDVEKFTDEKVALIARDKKIDIAIDLCGFTKNGRPSILAMRVAPIQITYLGYPGTTGANYIDYIISDKFIIPKKSQKYYSEKIIYLPKCYLPNEHGISISQKVYTRESEKLPISGFIFCCFNSCYKITPSIFRLWIRLLSKIKGSVLWFPGFSTIAIMNLRKECIKLGMDENRLVFSSIEKNRSDHLAKIKLADIFLDTYPYGAHSTASDFLRAGVPIVTLRGRSKPNQSAACLLFNLNLSDLIASSEEGYECLAINLATDSKFLNDIKNKLISNINSSSLFDIGKYTQGLESGYIQVYDRYHDNLAPDNIKVK
jgi:protein O-GlcNAc transferase